ncbi:MAG: hypothetical protein RLZZ77_1184 [Bacteroidota bacterium]
MRPLICCLIALCGFFPISFWGQNFSFSPSNEVFTTLNMEEYRNTQVDIDPNSSQTYAMSWRMVGNTCPAEWDIVLCDWSECYTFLPNNGDMDPIFPGQVGLIKLTVNPFSTPGSGYVHFWIYPTGDIDNHLDLFFYYDTILTATTEVDPVQSSLVYSSEKHGVELIHFPPGNYTIFNLEGKKVMEFKLAESRFFIDLSGIPKGVYVLTDGENRSEKLVVK